MAHGLNCGGNCHLGKYGAAKVGVQYRPGQIEDASQIADGPCLEPLNNIIGNCIDRRCLKLTGARL